MVLISTYFCTSVLQGSTTLPWVTRESFKNISVSTCQQGDELVTNGEIALNLS